MKPLVLASALPLLSPGPVAERAPAFPGEAGRAATLSPALAALETPGEGRGSFEGRAARLLELFDRSRPVRALASAPESVGRTPQFQAAYRRAGEDAGAEARRHKWLWAPGYMWDFVPGMYEPNLRALRSMGLEAEFLRLDSTAPSSKNAAAVIEAIERSRRPVVIIGHSKGGRDATAALQRRPDLAGKVTALVAMQTPFRGAALAKMFRASAAVRLWLQAALRLARHPLAGRQGLFEDTVDELCGPAGCVALPGVRLVSLTTRLGRRAHAAFAPLKLSGAGIRWMTGKDSDGMVLAEDQVLPGSEVVRLQGLSHGDTVLDSKLGRWLLGTSETPPYAPDRLTRAIVHHLFPRDP